MKTAGRAKRVVELHERNAAVHAADNWQSLTRTCADLVQLTQAQQLNIVLSDKLVRYACFPWRDELRNAAEDLAFAKLNFDDVYGLNASSAWHFGFSNGRPGMARLSIAIPQSLFGLLQGNFDRSLPPVKSIQTSFSATLRRHRKQLAPEGWLINLEDTRLTLGSWNAGGWNWIYSAHAEMNGPDALMSRLRQEMTLASSGASNSAPVQVYVHAPALEAQHFEAFEGVQLIPLASPQKPINAEYTFALLGAGT